MHRIVMHTECKHHANVLQLGYILHVKTTYRASCVAITLALIVLANALPSGAVPPTFASRPSRDSRTLVVVRDPSDVSTLDPDGLIEPTSEVVDCNIYDTLVTFHGQDFVHPHPRLATRWTISPNGRVFTFHLRHGMRFSNGVPLTASDVVFSYRRLGYLNDSPAFLMGAHTVR